MTDLCWKAVSNGTAIAEILVSGICFSCLIKPFVKRKTAAFCTGAVYFSAMLACYLIPLRFGSLIALGMSLFAAFFVMCRMDQRNYRQKIFLAALFFSLYWLTSAMAEILYDNLYGFLEHKCYRYMEEHPNLWFMVFVGLCAFYLTVETILMAVSIRCILKAYVCRTEDMAKRELLMLAAPSLAGIAGCQVARYYRGFYIMETWETADAYDAASWLYYVVSLVTIVVVIVLHQSMKAKQEEKFQTELLASQVENMMRHIGQVESLYGDIRSIRHDMANHILTLEALYAKEEYTEAKAYTAELKKALCVAGGELRSGNPVTDVILQEWKKEAERKGICFQCDFHFPTRSDINVFDVSVILNNILQNAIENTDRTGGAAWISVCSYRQQNAYMIEACNSFSGKLHRDSQNVLPVTTKEKPGSHGYGLLNVRKIAEKYCGTLDIAEGGGEFRVSVMMMAKG